MRLAGRLKEGVSLFPNEYYKGKEASSSSSLHSEKNSMSLHLKGACQKVPEGHLYKIADLSIVSDMEIGILSAWYVNGKRSRVKRYGNQPQILQNQLIFHGSAWLGNQERGVRFWSCGSDVAIDVDGLGNMLLLNQGRSLAYLGKPPVDVRLFEEALVGPGLLLAFAYREVFGLHASAVAADGKACVFIGESSVGKSTLAAFLGKKPETGWRRIGDDILPVGLYSGQPVAFPHFPQLKLRADEQVSDATVARLPLAAVYVLTSTLADEEGNQVTIGDLRPHAAALSIVRHTVASRFFPEALLEKHVTFCATVARQIPVKRLSYPRRFDVLPAVREALAEDLEKRVVSDQ